MREWFIKIAPVFMLDFFGISKVQNPVYLERELLCELKQDKICGELLTFK
jgi:hypothetical protein